MPAPDISYFLDSAAQLCHIGPDTYFYLYYACPEVNAVIDDYERTPRPHLRQRKHMDKLRDMGEYCEEQLIRWRASRPREAIAASYYARERFGEMAEMFVHEYAVGMVNNGHARMTRTAIRQQDEEYGFNSQMALLRRSIVRAYHDLEGWNGAMIDRALAENNRIFDQHRADALVAQAEIRRILGREDAESTERDRKRALAHIRAGLRQDRKIVKRSVRLAERFLGRDTTRVFLAGDRVRIAGRHAVYQLRKTGPVLGSHGSARLSVFTKEDDIHLCDVCIYTPKVPILDHVASLLLHIRAGEEDEILSVGNPFNIKEVAYDQPWLVPHLPAKAKKFNPDGSRVTVPRILPLPDGFPVYREPDRRDRLRVMRQEIAAHLFDAIGSYCPSMGRQKAYLLSGMDRNEYAREGQDDPFQRSLTLFEPIDARGYENHAVDLTRLALPAT